MQKMPLLNPINDINYSNFYNLERYLFSEVSKRYDESKTLCAFDFFCIVIWKANRAKSKVAGRLLVKGEYKNLDLAVAALLKEISGADGMKARLAVVMKDWGFRLPMASAILTVLYPAESTVYDVRVCAVLNDFQDAQYLKSDRLWKRYSEYVERVKALGGGPSLRDKDRWLWGKSFYLQLTKDIEDRFGRNADEAELDD